MRRSFALGVILGLGLVAASTAGAEMLTLNGTLASDPIPNGYHFDLSVMLPRNGALQLEVDGRSCTSGTPSGRECVRAIAFFSLPPGLELRGKQVWYVTPAGALMIGDVIGLGQVQWVRLRRGATIQATIEVAKLVLDTSLLSHGTREGLFELLYPARP